MGFEEPLHGDEKKLGRVWEGRGKRIGKRERREAGIKKTWSGNKKGGCRSRMGEEMRNGNGKGVNSSQTEQNKKGMKKKLE